ncbi:MAG: MCE family protein [Actinomycetota bacterium]|jgi:phospholipid/cholesterol/gamma-HCH transport system substrate-binding protein|nr:MCE family protein [Actinomycetota bacterium]
MSLRHFSPRHISHRLPKNAVKFALFAALCLVLLVGLAVKIGNISLFSSRRTYYAQLADVTGLTSGDQVDIAGVEVGQVGSITLQRTHALVSMSVNVDVSLRQGTDVGLRWLNVLGQKQIYLYPATQGPMLKPGATIPLSHDVSDASVDAFLNSIGPFLSAINPSEANAFVENVSGALEGDTAEINQLINNGATISQTVGALDTQVGAVIDSLDQVLTAIASRSSDVSSLVSNLQTVSQSLASRNDLLDQVVVNLSQVTGDLANLIGQDRSTIDSSISSLETVTQTIASHRQQLAQTLSTLGSGLAPYAEISSYGQWFQVQTIYTCLANQTSCSYYEPLTAPAGSGPGGGPPLSAPSLPGTSAAGASATGAGTPGSAPGGSISTILRAVGGAG